MKKIVSARTLFDCAWTAAKATWKIVLPLVAVIQLASYVVGQLTGFIPGALGTLLSFVGTAVMMVPTVGVLSGALGYFRGKPLTADCIGSMSSHTLKIIGLYLWTMLCLFGWMLPGAAVMAVGGVMLVLGTDGTAIIAFGGLLLIAGMIVMIVTACRAAFSYSMSNCILIDEPAMPVRDILKRSRVMMHGYRWHYFKVGLPVFAGVLVIAPVLGPLTASLPQWLDSLIVTVLGVATATMSQYIGPVMYEELKRIGR